MRREINKGTVGTNSFFFERERWIPA